MNNCPHYIQTIYIYIYEKTDMTHKPVEWTH